VGGAERDVAQPAEVAQGDIAPLIFSVQQHSPALPRQSRS
jgi:hypothetical protein